MNVASHRDAFERGATAKDFLTDLGHRCGDIDGFQILTIFERKGVDLCQLVGEGERFKLRATFKRFRFDERDALSAADTPQVRATLEHR